MGQRTFRIGTRGSALALAQTRQVIAALRSLHPDTAFEKVVIRTTGDAVVDRSLALVGTKGMFIRELEEALLDGRVDLAVHSMKDLPAELAPGLEISCVPERADPRDAWVCPSGNLSDIPAGAVVGSSSPRRAAVLHDVRPNITLQDIRGNVDTRLRKLDSGQYAALVLACAGLDRLGLAHRITCRLDPTVFVPAPGQGALAIEGRIGDNETRDAIRRLHHTETDCCVRAERAFQLALNAGCSVPAGAWACIRGDRISATAMISCADGPTLLRASDDAPIAEASVLGTALARKLLDTGGPLALPGNNQL